MAITLINFTTTTLPSTMVEPESTHPITPTKQAENSINGELPTSSINPTIAIGLRDTSSTTKQSTHFVDGADTPWKVSHSKLQYGSPTDSYFHQKPRLSSSSDKERSRSSCGRSRSPDLALISSTSKPREPKHASIEVDQHSNGLNLLQPPFFPTIAYLSSSQTPTLVPCTSPTNHFPAPSHMPQIEEEGQEEIDLTSLEALRKSNEEMELILANFGEPSTNVLVLEKLFLREFNEPFSLVILAYCHLEMKTFTLNLRNMKEHILAQ